MTNHAVMALTAASGTDLSVHFATDGDIHIFRLWAGENSFRLMIDDPVQLRDFGEQLARTSGAMLAAAEILGTDRDHEPAS